MPKRLEGQVALVVGATRGAGRGIAVELGAAGATVYCTGRTTSRQRSPYDRPETIEETAELVTAAGGTGVALQVDHLDVERVRELVHRIDTDQDLRRLIISTGRRRSGCKPRPWRVRPGAAGLSTAAPTWRRVGPGSRDWELPGGSFSGRAVDRFAEQICVPGVSGVLLDHVGQQPAEVHPVVGRLVEPAVGQHLGQ